MEEPAGGWRRSQLPAHADLVDEYSAETLGVEGRSPDRFGTGILQIQDIASLDVKTSFDVAKHSVVSKVLSLTGAHGHVVAALLSELQDVQGSPCFDNCETEFRLSKCIRQGGEPWPNTWYGQPRTRGRPEGGDLRSEGSTTMSMCSGYDVIGYSETAKKNRYAWHTISSRSWTRTWSQARVAVVDEFSQGRRRHNAEGGRLALHGSVRCVGISFPLRR